MAQHRSSEAKEWQIAFAVDRIDRRPPGRARLIEACRHFDAKLGIGWPAKLGVIANALMPEIVATILRLASAEQRASAAAECLLMHAHFVRPQDEAPR